MANPGGNYPGRQIFLGKLDGKPAFAYFGSGRSKKSQERYATPVLYPEHAIRINPLDPNEPFDPFRHYQAVRIDPKTGLLLVSNSQAPNDAIFEAYKLRDTDKKYAHPISRLMHILRSIGPERDDYQTPRIIGVIDPRNTSQVEFDAGIVSFANYDQSEKKVSMPDDMLRFLQTYNGKGGPDEFDFTRYLSDDNLFTPHSRTSGNLAEEIYEISDYIHPEHGELRVWCIAGVRNGNGPGGWDIAIKNRHPIPPISWKHVFIDL